MSRAAWAAGLTALLVAACARGPEPIRWGVDTCERCRMVISDPRFGAAFVATGGRQVDFDGVDELARYLDAAKPTGTAYVTDGGTAGALVPAEGAVFVASPSIQAPMGGHVMSFATAAAAQTYVAKERLAAARYLTYDAARHVAVQEAPDAHH
jgi:copper chaperone NosL